MRSITSLIAVLITSIVQVSAAEKPAILFSISSDGKGEVAEFSKKALFDRNDGDKMRYGQPINFIVDSIKIWTFEGDGDKVTMYSVGIAGKITNPAYSYTVLLRRGKLSYRGSLGEAGVGAAASKGIDELLLEPGQSYVVFQLKEREEAIAVARDLAALLK